MNGAGARTGRPPGRPPRFDRRAVQPVLERLWGASDQLSGKLLHAIVPALLTALETHHGLVIAPSMLAALLAASPATLDRWLGGAGGTPAAPPPGRMMCARRCQCAPGASGRAWLRAPCKGVGNTYF